MSFLAGLDMCDKSPGEYWGRYSVPRSRGINLSSTESSPEKAELSFVKQSKRKKSCTRKVREQSSSSDAIVIKEDRETILPQSDTDRKPQEYASIRVGKDFKIPKTKHQTERASSSKVSPPRRSGGWIQCGPRQRIGPASRRKSLPNKISRPKRTSSQEDESQSLAFEEIRQYKSDESDDEKCAKKHDSKEDQNGVLKLDKKKSSEDFKTSEPLDIANFFCPKCNAAMGRTECRACGQPNISETKSFPTVTKFYGNKAKYGHKYHSSGKPKKTSQNNQRKITQNNQAQKKARGGLLNGQTQIDIRPVPKKKCGGPKPKKLNTIKSPELVHISSDEEDVQDIAAQDATLTDTDECHVTDMETEEDCKMQDSEETSLSTEQIESNDISDDTNISEIAKPEMRKRRISEQNVVKREMASPNFFYFRDDMVVELPVDWIFVGRLCGKSQTPIIVTSEFLKITLQHDQVQYIFKLRHREFKALKLNNFVHPWYIVIQPTSGWARKANERYAARKNFIDPGSPVHDERQIVLMLTRQMTATKIIELEELITDCLGGTGSFSQIKPENATSELKRMVASCSNDNVTEFLVKSKSSHLQSSMEPDNAPPKDCTVPVQKAPSLSNTLTGRKSYNTRSSSVVQQKRQPSERILVYPPRSKTGVTITTEDLECLQPDTYLNDVIIDFFLKYLFEEQLSSEDKERTHIFSSFFYKRLTQKNHGTTAKERNAEVMHGFVKTWTKNVDIFSKDFIVVPINECAHWYLAIICFPELAAKQQFANGEYEQEGTETSNIFQDLLDRIDNDVEKDESRESESEQLDDFDQQIIKSLMKRTKRRNSKRKKSQEKSPMKSRPCLLIFDSLSHTSRPQMLVNLRNYLTCEWAERRSEYPPVIFDKNNIKACFPKVPGQNNSSDCGIYVLQYVESFFKNPFEDYNFPISKTDWFPLEVIADKRQYLRDLILDLQAKEQIKESR